MIQLTYEEIIKEINYLDFKGNCKFIEENLLKLDYKPYILEYISSLIKSLNQNIRLASYAAELIIQKRIIFTFCYNKSNLKLFDISIYPHCNLLIEIPRKNPDIELNMSNPNFENEFNKIIKHTIKIYGEQNA